MHIVLVTNELATEKNASGGLASFTANMARIFAEKGHRVSVILFTTKEFFLEFDSDIELENVFVRKEVWDWTDKLTRIICFGKKKLYDELRRAILDLEKSYYISRAISKLNKKSKVDIVHYCNLQAPSLLALKNIPYVVRMSSLTRTCMKAHERYYSIEQKEYPATLRMRMEETAMKRARYVISPSLLCAELTQRLIGIKPDILESPFVLERRKWNDTVYNQKLKDKMYILHYGSLSYFKGTHIVAETIWRLLKEYSDIYLVMAGSSEEIYDENSGMEWKAFELVKQRAGEYGDRVLYLGQLVREKLYPIIENAQICWLPYRLDNLSNACIEAMAMGKIVIGTERSSFEQLIEDRISGFLCERESPESNFSALKEALQMTEQEKQKMGEEAKKQIERLHPEEIYKNYLEYYEKVIREW